MKITVLFTESKKNRIIKDVTQVLVSDVMVSFVVSAELKFRYVLANILGWVVEG